MGDDTYIHSLCPQYGESEVKAMLAPLQAENARLRELLVEWRCTCYDRAEPPGRDLVEQTGAAIDAAGGQR